MPILIVGHKNPDTDSVCSVIAYSYLKNIMSNDTIPCILGPISKETEFVLNYFKIRVPKTIKNVFTQVNDLDIDKIACISPETTILNSYKVMEENNYKTLAIIDSSDKLIGIITMKDIAMSLINGDYYSLDSSVDSIINSLGGKVLSGAHKKISGKIQVIAYDYESAKGLLDHDSIVIVGDRYDIIEHSIERKVQLIMVTGGNELPENLISKAKNNSVTVLSVPTDTYTTSKLINECNYVYKIMKSKDIIKFNENDYISDIKDTMVKTSYRNYPVVDDKNHFLGFLGRRHLLKSGSKKVILLDHNEYAQSVDGLDEAEILEIVDHHKLGDITTYMPIAFRNMPVGSTCTIIYQFFKENNIIPPKNIAGLMLSGILSDTLLFKSPTTTQLDTAAAEDLNKIVNVDLKEYATSMFWAGTSLEGISVEEIFYRDFKEFTFDQYKIGISQVYTLDIKYVLEKERQFLSFLTRTHKNKGYFLTLMVLTDIIKEGSYLLFKSKHEGIISAAFKVNEEEGVFVPNIVSRKKQIIPMLMDGINMIK